MSHEEAFQVIIRTIQGNPDLKPRKAVQDLAISSVFKTDLGYDSLSLASLFYDLQDLYPELNEEEMVGWKTLEDCCRSIENAAR